MDMNRAVIIVAAGKGRRMQNILPKQFMELGGKPVILQSIEPFIEAFPGIQLIVVLTPGYFRHWDEIVKKYDFNYPVHCCKGGAERWESVQRGLELVDPEAIVAVHDAVRPFVSESLIRKLFHEAEMHQSAVPAIEPKDTIRQLVNGSSTVLPREHLRLVQTPQVFRANILKNAYASAELEGITDDSSVVEKAGYPVHLVAGDERNLKITTPEDFSYAEYLFSCKKQNDNIN